MNEMIKLDSVDRILSERFPFNAGDRVRLFVEKKTVGHKKQNWSDDVYTVKDKVGAKWRSVYSSAR